MSDTAAAAIASIKPQKNQPLDNGMLRHGRMLIDGEWVDAASGETFDAIYPGTGEVIARVAAGDREDVDRAAKAARRAFESGEYTKMNGADRGRLLWRIADLMEQNIEELAELETLNNGKPLLESLRVDLPQSIASWRYYAGWAGKATGETIEPNARTNAFAFTLREPVGVCGQIIPWNFPIQMATWKIAPAIACGNTVVIKPAEQTSLSILRLGELMMEAGMPKGVVNIVTGFGATAGAAIVEHPEIDKIAFTGSVEIGKLIMRNASSTLKKVTLELGGKSPNVVFADSNLELAAKVALSGIFFNQGQMCTAGSRILIEEAAREEFMGILSSRAKKMVVGDPLDPKTRMGSLVSEEQMNRVMSYIAKGREEGASLVAGGERVGDRGYFVTPTVFADVRNDMTIAQEEIFGPVASVIAFTDEADAIRIANDSRFGLAAGVWTNDVKKAISFARGVKAGTVWVNTYNMTDNALPFGGYKDSGFGRELGAAALDIYTQTKTVWIDLG
ncbi:MAG TPA: aldehyde dehydrogenase family protein [Candidatus Kapabacteria bacterium]|jgi:acyl-CoA reductase-like NAD-dependent aldehyde dehydrogenase|nr:aldehyde dehydrogenase family protein [Candidatus Kapabacteria bacterium]